jgi:hypothetical protein
LRCNPLGLSSGSRLKRQLWPDTLRTRRLCAQDIASEAAGETIIQRAGKVASSGRSIAANRLKVVK